MSKIEAQSLAAIIKAAIARKTDVPGQWTAGVTESRREVVEAILNDIEAAGWRIVPPGRRWFVRLPRTPREYG